MTFRVGEKVVCIKRDAWNQSEWEMVPVFKGIYTIREIDVLPDGNTYLRFEEIVNRPSCYADGRSECCFLAARFRPIVESKTDISFAHEILRKASRKESVRA